MDSYLRVGNSGVRRVEAVRVDLDEDRSRSRLEGGSKCARQGRGAGHYCHSMRLDSVDMDSGGGVGLLGQEQAGRIAEVGGQTGRDVVPAVIERTAPGFRVGRQGPVLPVRVLRD